MKRGEGEDCFRYDYLGARKQFMLSISYIF